LKNIYWLQIPRVWWASLASMWTLKNHSVHLWSIQCFLFCASVPCSLIWMSPRFCLSMLVTFWLGVFTLKGWLLDKDFLTWKFRPENCHSLMEIRLTSSHYCLPISQITLPFSLLVYQINREYIYIYIYITEANLSMMLGFIYRKLVFSVIKYLFLASETKVL
jgi:hypothetical protein